MKEKIRKEVMKVFNQEDSVDDVVNNILRLFDVSKQSEQLVCDVCSKTKPTINGLEDCSCKKGNMWIKQKEYE